jgi:uncharacterized protein YybS (DUF2232 family)
MKFPERGSLVDLLAGSVATLALFLAYVMFPLVGMLPGILAPFPAMFYSLKRGTVIGSAIVLVTTVVLVILGDFAAILLYLLQCGVISLALPAFLSSSRGGARSIAYAVAIDLSVILLMAGVCGATQGGDIHAQVLKGIQSSISQTSALYDRAGIKGEDLKALQQGMAEAGTLIGRIYPALVVISLVLIAGINLLILKKTATRLPVPLPVGEFVGFKNPEQLVWVLIIAGFALLVPNRFLTTTALNVLVVTLALYFVQGMAIISQFYTRFTVPKFARYLFYLVLALQPYLAIMVAMLGIFDLWGNFRAPKSHKNL